MGDVVGVVRVKAGGVGIRWRGTAGARGENQLGGATVQTRNKKHVASRPIEQRGKHLGGGSGTIFAKDSLVEDSAGDLDPGASGDIAQDLIETGV
jgi:hypothetical protein